MWACLCIYMHVMCMCVLCKVPHPGLDGRGGQWDGDVERIADPRARIAGEGRGRGRIGDQHLVERQLKKVSKT